MVRKVKCMVCSGVDDLTPPEYIGRYLFILCVECRRLMNKEA